MTTRVWFENDAIQMDGLGPFPARSLFTIADGDRIHILTLSGVRQTQLEYTGYARRDGSGFVNAGEAKAYIDSQLDKPVLGADPEQIQAAIDAALSDVPDFALQFDSAAT